MGKNSWIMFGMVAVVIISILLVALLILVPQGQPITDGALEEYDNISQSEYSYAQSKDISEEAMIETYSVTSEDIKEGKASKLYKQGNTDPFAAVGSSSSEGGTTSGTGNSGSGNNASTSSGNKGSGKGNTTVRPYSAEDK